jgi:TonB C terminal
MRSVLPVVVALAMITPGCACESFVGDTKKKSLPRRAWLFQDEIWTAEMQGILQDHWHPSQGIPIKQSLLITFLLSLTREGEILDKKRKDSSGNICFDKTVWIAQARVKRFPASPVSQMSDRPHPEIATTGEPPQREKEFDQ